MQPNVLIIYSYTWKYYEFVDVLFFAIHYKKNVITSCLILQRLDA